MVQVGTLYHIVVCIQVFNVNKVCFHNGSDAWGDIAHSRTKHIHKEQKANEAGFFL